MVWETREVREENWIKIHVVYLPHTTDPRGSPVDHFTWSVRSEIESKWFIFRICE
jgi:hypothetical protein